MKSISNLLNNREKKDHDETDKLFTLMYDDLRRLAAKYLQHEPKRARLSSVSLVHQAYVRMVDQSKVSWKGKTHFFAVGRKNHAKDSCRPCRGSIVKTRWRRKQLQLDDEYTFRLNQDEDVVALDEITSFHLK